MTSRLARLKALRRHGRRAQRNDKVDSVLIQDSTRRQWIKGAAGAAVGTTAFVAGGLRPPPASAQTKDTYVRKSEVQAGTLAAPANTEIWRFQPRDPAKGPFTIQQWGADFFGTWDNVIGLGYNIGVGGAQAVANEPQFKFNIEQDYFESGTKHTLEAYFEYVPKSGRFADTRRPLFWQFDRNLNTNQVGSFPAFVIQAESVWFQKWTDLAPFLALAPGNFTMIAVPATPSSFALQAPAGQGSAFYMQHGAANALTISTIAATQVRFDVGTASLFGFANIGWSVNLYDNTHSFGVAQLAVNHIGLRVQKIAAATADMVQLRSNDGTTILSRFNKDGYFITKKTAAPADADLNTNEGAIWWDPTPGTGGFRYKGKDSAGAVLSGSL